MRIVHIAFAASLLGSMTAACAGPATPQVSAIEITIPVPIQATGTETAILRGIVFDRSTDVPLERARVQVKELADISAGELRHHLSGSDGLYEFQELRPRLYWLSCQKEGYQPYDVRLQVELGPPNHHDCPMVPSALVSSEPFEDGTLQSIFQLGTPLSRMESAEIVVTLDDAQVVSLNVGGFERQMVVATVTITNASASPVYLALTDSYLVGQTRVGLSDGLYDARYGFDDVGSQFLAEKLPIGFFWIEEGDSVTGEVGFWDQRQLFIPADLVNVTPVLCLGWGVGGLVIEAREFCTHHPELVSPYLQQ